MVKYEKPSVILNEDTTEGIFMASGDSGESGGGGGSTKCQSIYMKGVYHPMKTHSDADANHTAIERGCEGCNANWGYCAVDQCNYDGVFKPSWEVAGKGPDDPWS